MISIASVIAPTASAQSAAIASSTTRSSTAPAPSGSPITSSASTRTLAQRDFRRAQPVLGGIAAPRHPWRRGVDEKQAEAAFFAPAARGAREHDQLLRAIAVEHEAFLAVEHPSRPVLPRARRDVEQVEAGAPLGMREGQSQLAGGDRGDHRLALGLARAVAQHAAAEHDRRQIRLQDERAAEGLLDQHRLDRAAAEAAISFGERRAEQAEFRVLAP